MFRLLNSQPHGRLDWVDASPPMLELAEESNRPYPERRHVIRFVQQDMLAYLADLHLDLRILPEI